MSPTSTLTGRPMKVRWRRVTAPKACDFCVLLASRGAVYTESTSTFRCHDHCSCTAEPEFNPALKAAIRRAMPHQVRTRAVEAHDMLRDDPLAKKLLAEAQARLAKPGLTGEAALERQKVADLVDAIMVDEDRFARAFVGVEKTVKPVEWTAATTPEQRREIARRMVVNEIQGWNGTSTGGVRAQVRQRAATEEFGLEKAANASRGGTATAEIDEAYRIHGEGVRMILRAMYERTQEQLREAGVSSVKLFRGMNLRKKLDIRSVEGVVAEMPLNPLSSFSAELNVSKSFANETSGYLLSAEVPAERLLSLASNGLGVMREAEYVVVGGGQMEFRVAPKILINESIKKGGAFA